MLIQGGYLQTMEFSTAQRTSKGPWAIQVITSLSQRYVCLVLILGKRELLTQFPAARIMFCCSIAMNWSTAGFCRNQSTETKCNTRGNTQSSCSSIPGA